MSEMSPTAPGAAWAGRLGPALQPGSLAMACSARGAESPPPLKLAVGEVNFTNKIRIAREDRVEDRADTDAEAVVRWRWGRRAGAGARGRERSGGGARAPGHPHARARRSRVGGPTWPPCPPWRLLAIRLSFLRDAPVLQWWCHGLPVVARSGGDGRARARAEGLGLGRQHARTFAARSRACSIAGWLPAWHRCPPGAGWRSLLAYRKTVK